MTTLALLVLIPLVSYLVGAIPFGYLVARAKGVDILHQGSGNIGATNVGRILGRRLGLLVFLLDFAKGAVPVLVVTLWHPAAAAELPPETLPVAAGIATFLGHLLPVYLRFRGGKGVATGAGVVVVLMPGPAVAALLTWLVVLASSRYVSLASLCAGAMLCGLRLAGPAPFDLAHRVVSIFCLVAVALIFVRHRANIQRLALGTENRLKDSPAMLALSKTLHVLAVGLWFGTVVFFTFVVGLAVFHTFESVAVQTDAQRPLWFPEWKVRESKQVAAALPNELHEQGTRAAGRVVGALFPPYFALQAGCGFVALATALGWSAARRGERVHRIRSLVLLVAFVSVGIGWWLEREVHALGAKRDPAVERVLNPDVAATPAQVEEAVSAVQAFRSWHGYSMGVNLLTLILVTVAMALAAQLPAGPLNAPEAGEKQETAVVRPEGAVPSSTPAAS